MRKVIRFLGIVIFMLGVLVPSGFQVKAEDGAPRVYDNIQFLMDDGTELIGTVTAPPDGVKQPREGYPLITIIHGWGGDRGTFEFPEFAKRLANDGFVVLTYDVRGFGESGGYAAVASDRELKDLHLLLRLMLENRTTLDQSGGIIYPEDITINPDEIGVSGVSYGGGHSFLAAASNFDPDTYVIDGDKGITDPETELADPIKYPKVAAIAPIVGWTDLNDALFPNRVFKLSYSTALSIGSMGRADPVLYEWLASAFSGVNEQMVIDDLKDRSVLYDGHFLNDDMATNSIDDVPIYMIQAWEDYLFPAEQALNLYEKLEGINSDVKMYLGNTGHPPASLSINSAEAKYMFNSIHDWFAYWLKGDKSKKVFHHGKVTVAPEPGTFSADISLEDWKNKLTHHESLPETKDVTFYLNNNKRLLQSEPGMTALPDTIVLNPANGLEDDPVVSNLPEVGSLVGQVADAMDPLTGPLPNVIGNVYYYSEPLTDEMTVFGQPTFDLYTASTGLKVQLIGKIYELAPDGTATLLTRGAKRYEQFTQMLPQRTTFKPFADYHRFQKGHQIVIELGMSDLPFYKTELTNLVMNLYHDRTRASKITFPVLGQ